MTHDPAIVERVEAAVLLLFEGPDSLTLFAEPRHRRRLIIDALHDVGLVVMDREDLRTLAVAVDTAWHEKAGVCDCDEPLHPPLDAILAAEPTPTTCFWDEHIATMIHEPGCSHAEPDYDPLDGGGV